MPKKRSGDRIDEIAVQLVCDGHSMPLRGATRAEAIRRLIKRGLIAREIAWRIKMRDGHAVSRWGRDHGIKVPTYRPEHWTVRYVETHRDPANRLRWKRGQL